MTPEPSKIQVGFDLLPKKIFLIQEMPFFNFHKRPNIQNLKATKDIDGLISALEYPDDHNIRLAAASALGKIGDGRAVNPLITRLKDQRRVREAAVQSLGLIGDERAVDPLMTLLEDESWEVRSTVAKALGRIGAIRAIPHLKELLDDDNDNVRWYASQAIEELEGKSIP